MVVINSSFLVQKLRGVNRYAVEISKELKLFMPDIKFIAPKTVIKNNYTEEINPEIYENKIKISTKQVTPWEQFELTTYLRQNKNPLLVNLTNTAPVFYKNQIITIHDLMFMRNPKWYTRKHYYFYKYLFNGIAQNSLKVITVSECSKRDLIKYFNISENKIEIIHNAVSQEFINLATANFENKYGDYILAVSSLDPRKNFERLIRAFNKLKLKNIKLVIVGDEGTLYKKETFKYLIKDNPDVVFTGYVTDDELAGLYKNAKLFVFPSLYEGFGIPPLEAMACNCPTIVSNAASIPEVCADASYYVDPNSIDSIAKGIYEVINDKTLQDELRQKGAERVKKFSWEDSARKIAEIIKNIA